MGPDTGSLKSTKVLVCQIDQGDRGLGALIGGEAHLQPELEP